RYRRPVRTEFDDRRLTPDVDRPQEPPTRRLEDPHVPVLAPLGEPLAVRAVRDLRPPEGKRMPADARHPGLKRRVIKRATKRECRLRCRRRAHRRHGEPDRALPVATELRVALTRESPRLPVPCRALCVM